MISGPPGIGKTTAVRIIAKELGYDIIEQNASDVRNKASLNSFLRHLTDNTIAQWNTEKTSKVMRNITQQIHIKLHFIEIRYSDGRSGWNVSGR